MEKRFLKIFHKCLCMNGKHQTFFIHISLGGLLLLLLFYMLYKGIENTYKQYIQSHTKAFVNYQTITNNFLCHFFYFLPSYFAHEPNGEGH